MLVTLPKGKPKAITSVSVTSPGNFLIWRTREGAPSILSSPLNFLLSLPLAERHIQTLFEKLLILLALYLKNAFNYEKIFRFDLNKIQGFRTNSEETNVT